MAIYYEDISPVKVIPLHSLIICDRAETINQFAPHECVALKDIGLQLVGHRRHYLNHIIYDEMRHRVALKLSLGERVVIATMDLGPEQRRQLVSLAHNQGAAVFNLTEEPETALGEPIATQATIRPVTVLPTVDILQHLRAQGWQGITVIGDVHGELAALETALSWAYSRQHFVWLLGDILDYGADTLETVDRVHRAVMHGEAALVLANHERKIARWLDRSTEHLRISEGNRVTIDALDRLSGRERGRWVGRFRGLLAHTALMQQIGDVTLMHAAAHPSLWTNPDPQAIENFALYGESDHVGGRYRRTHRWIDCVPEGKLVVVGHDVISPEYPLVITGQRGGKVVFLDTGCGKGGHLSSADFRFNSTGLYLESFKRN